MATTNTTSREEQPDNDKSSQGFYQDWDARIPSTASLQQDVRSRNATIHGEEATFQFWRGAKNLVTDENPTRTLPMTG